MATVAKLRDRIKRRLTRTSFTNLDALIVDEMDHAQVEILEAEKWLPHFLKTSQSITWSISHFTIALHANSPKAPEQNQVPTGFIRLLEPNSEVVGLSYLDPTITQGARFFPVPRYDSFTQLKQIHGDGLDTATFPGGYWWDGNPEGVLQMRPQTIGAVSYQLYYYRHAPTIPSSPDADGTTLWTRNAGDYLMHTTGVEVATYLRDKTALDYFVSKRQEAFDRIRGLKTAIDQGDDEFVMGDD